LDLKKKIKPNYRTPALIIHCWADDSRERRQNCRYYESDIYVGECVHYCPAKYTAISEKPWCMCRDDLDEVHLEMPDGTKERHWVDGRSYLWYNKTRRYDCHPRNNRVSAIHIVEAIGKMGCRDCAKYVHFPYGDTGFFASIIRLLLRRKEYCHGPLLDDTPRG